jgi:aspartate aminotransferase-like enzyme
LSQYSVIYTDRAINLMSAPFGECMRDVSRMLKEVYRAQHTALIPGSGTFAMEAVARQFGTGKRCLVVRNGYFSFRWSDIFATCGIPKEEVVLKAKVSSTSATRPPVVPISAAEAVKRILEFKPDVVFAPHVETATGILLSDDYIRELSAATHEVGGLFVLDVIAAGCLWADMPSLGVDVLVTAPQKGWSGPACCGVVMLNDKARQVCAASKPTSFSCNLPKWLEVMDKFEQGAFLYHTTLPTDAIMAWREVMVELRDTLGFDGARQAACRLGALVRAEMKRHGLDSVAAEGWEAPTVVVVYADSPDMVARFKEQGLQVAGGVPFKLDEPEGLKTFRVGLFGIDKLRDPERAAKLFADALTLIMAKQTNAMQPPPPGTHQTAVL